VGAAAFDSLELHPYDEGSDDDSAPSLAPCTVGAVAFDLLVAALIAASVVAQVGVPVATQVAAPSLVDVPIATPVAAPVFATSLAPHIVGAAAFDMIVAVSGDDDNDNEPDGHQGVNESSDDDNGSNDNDVGDDEAMAVKIVYDLLDEGDGMIARMVLQLMTW
jgi:hypothetical protein